MKTCKICRKTKKRSKFSKHLIAKDGLGIYCKDCAKALNRKYRQNHKTETATRNRKYQQEHKIEARERDKKYRKTVKGYLHAHFGAIKQRCNDPKVPTYEYYGGRGIKCLFKSSEEYIEYVLNHLQIDPRGLQIDRIDNNGHYEPGNIRFVTRKVNCNNRRPRKERNE